MSDPDPLRAAVEGLVHEPTQVHDGGLDLTVAEIYDHAGPGRLDFGGAELEAAETSPLGTERRDPDDDYGWWHLDPGGYLLEHNETLAGGWPVRLEPRVALVERGAFHPTITIESLGLVPLAVGDGGLWVKENARVSTLRAAE